ncbi:MAG: indole-3-glycerol phosphate synthase TrpC [Nitrospirae bacterium]|nr:indole-3-glycerol phosphate synthase TrpC [Nitrospirota bacterium]
MSLINKIIDKKKERLNDLKTKVTLKEIKSMAFDVESPRNFTSAIKRDSGPLRLIAEIKKASPIKGVLIKEFEPIKIASIYLRKNVDAISVISEEDFFQGKIEYLLDVKKVTNIPILRKDFIFDEYQIYESRANGADAILLIASILEEKQSIEYLYLVKELGLSAIFEVHNFIELEMALHANAYIIGINNRDLKTLNVNLNTTFELKKEIPEDKIVVSESGIKTREDVKRLEDSGVDSILVGTVFMEAEDIGKKIDEIMGRIK